MPRGCAIQLALKYRPQGFGDVVGQEHVVYVIVKAIHKHLYKNGSLPAGFLLSGPRGSGKTSVGRIIAASLNCVQEGRRGVEPCHACINCLSVRLSNCPFVMEVDAASTNSVDHIRAIKEIINKHHDGHTRVIILDEAHSLTPTAFEALLKTLEEPPPDTLFVLATTAPDSFPDTILSRLMRFDYKRITPDLISKRLAYICQQEAIQTGDGKILEEIAKKAQGGMRDAIMMLEQMSNYVNPITTPKFYEYYGIVDGGVHRSLVEYAKRGAIADAKKIIFDVFSRGVDIHYFFDSFMSMVAEDETLTHSESVDCYRVAVEVKSKLKYMNSEIALQYMFTLLLKAFHAGVAGEPAKAASVADLDTVF